MSHTTLADNKHRAYGLKYCMFMNTLSPMFDTIQIFCLMQFLKGFMPLLSRCLDNQTMEIQNKVSIP